MSKGRRQQMSVIATMYCLAAPGDVEPAVP